MSSISQSSLKSETTFCSELELTEWRCPSNFKLTKIPPRIITSNARDRRLDEPCVRESLENYSSPLLPTYAEHGETIPPSQLRLQSNHAVNINMSSQVKFQPEFPKTEQTCFVSKLNINSCYSNHLKDKASKTANHFKGAQNKIFETQGSHPTYSRYKSPSRNDNFDTVSISSENVSKIVDREIALYRKKKTQRTLRTKHYCLTQTGQLHNIRSCPHATKQSKPLRSVVENKKQHLENEEESHESKQYNLTEDQLKEVACYCRISLDDLKTAIKRVLRKEIGHQDSDECHEVNCSQSPIKRRYVSSQLTYTSSVSK